MPNNPMTPPCILKAWSDNEHELKHWLIGQVADKDHVADPLHDIFIKALSQGNAFCNINNPRAWLFQVARNYLVDSYRKDKKLLPLSDDIDVEIDTDIIATVDELTQCLPRVLSELNPEDSDLIQRCDIEGMMLQHYAQSNHLTLSATKSRIQRARKRLRENLTQKCQIVLDDRGSVCCFTPRK
jgi:RNA polymerase sigma-70 factor, ECF subfamily